ncbi:S1 Rna binding domain-containing protein [Cardiosporidium cionae]|uniref:S1 Rna binding domain-containing protein n=1 Tax=Cardiosporidium cionae TaxID=476202 RepID=A0ABQ7JDU8_9APIC|nr:S1 Rna binding domain-containing protein [Cardiosporidium cionae]|eukprot:KAF8822146.1 S1 Rna binding domain-containing protein [Cardiosporidium cionae]
MDYVYKGGAMNLLKIFGTILWLRSPFSCLSGFILLSLVTNIADGWTSTRRNEIVENGKIISFQHSLRRENFRMYSNYPDCTSRCGTKKNPSSSLCVPLQFTGSNQRKVFRMNWWLSSFTSLHFCGELPLINTEKLKEFSSQELPFSKLVSWYMPESLSLMNSQKAQSQSFDERNDIPATLRSVNEWFRHSLNILQREFNKENRSKSNLSLNESLNSSFVRKDIIASHPASLLPGILWNAGKTEELRNLKNEDGASRDGRLNSLLQEMSKPLDDAKNNSFTRGYIPEDFPTSTLQFFREYELSNNTEWEQKFRDDPLKIAKKFQKALYDFDQYFSNKIRKLKKGDNFFSNETLNFGSSPFQEFDPERIRKEEIDIISPFSNSLEKSLTFDSTEKQIGHLIAEKANQFGYLPNVKKLIKTTEWLKGSPTARKDEEIVGFTYDDLDEALQRDSPLVFVPPNKLISGTIVRVNQRTAFVDIGAKVLASLSLEEAFPGTASIPKKGLKAIFKQNDSTFFEVLHASEAEIFLTLRSIYKFCAWENILRLEELDSNFSGNIMQVNKGGAVVNVLGLMAFLPNSQYCADEELSDKVVGKSIPLKILQVDLASSKLIVSNKRAELEKELRSLRKGDLVEGTVVATKRFGVIVKFHHCSAILHVSQISAKRVEKPGNLFPIGSQLKAIVIDYDKSTGQIFLSTKELETRPGDILLNKTKVFEDAEEKYQMSKKQLKKEKEQQSAASQELLHSLGLNASLFIPCGNNTADDKGKDFEINSLQSGRLQEEKQARKKSLMDILLNQTRCKIVEVNSTKEYPNSTSNHRKLSKRNFVRKDDFLNIDDQDSHDSDFLY